jgi:hypothetical protein
MYGGWLSSYCHPVSLVHINHVIIIFLHKVLLYSIHFILSSQKLTSAGGCWILVNVWMSFLSLHTTAIKSSMIHTQVPHCFNLIFLCPRSCGMPFLLDLTVPQQFLFFFVKSLYKAGEVKKLSIYNLWPCPSIFIVSSDTVACVAVRSCVLCCLSFPKYNFMWYM